MKLIFILFSSGLVFSALVSCKEKEAAAGADAPPAAEPATPSAPVEEPARENPEPALDVSNPRANLDSDLARLMAGFGATVKDVQDQASWAEAKPKIEAILGEIEIVRDRLRALPAPTPAEARTFFPRTKAREAALEKTLGSKDDFLGKLPKDVAGELGALAGQFFVKMGDAQIALRGTSPPVKTIVPKPPR